MLRYEKRVSEGLDLFSHQKYSWLSSEITRKILILIVLVIDYSFFYKKIFNYKNNLNFNNNFMKWPYAVTPYEVALIPSLQKNDKSNYLKAEKIYNLLLKDKIDVLFDDTDENLSSKFKKFDLIGIHRPSSLNLCFGFISIIFLSKAAEIFTIGPE